MTKDVSIAEARNDFTQLVRRAERGEAVRVTRRGRPVAVLLSVEDYQRLLAPRPTFREVVRAFVNEVPREELMGPDPFADLRDQAAGREVDL